MLTLPKVHSLHVAIHPAHSTLVCLVLHCDCGQPGTQAPLYCSLLGTELTVIAGACMAGGWCLCGIATYRSAVQTIGKVIDTSKHKYHKLTTELGI